MGSSTSFHETNGETFTKWMAQELFARLSSILTNILLEESSHQTYVTDQLVESTIMIEVQKHILEVRQNNAYAAEAYSFNLSDTTGEFPDISIPESRTGVTGDCMLALMLEVEKLALKHNIPLTGHCTDSAANKLASPTTFIGTT